MTTIRETLAEIRKPLPREAVAQMSGRGGSSLSYIPWYIATELMDERAPSWQGEIVERWHDTVTVGRDNVDGCVHLRIRVTIPCDDGILVREAVGLDDEPDNSYGSPVERAYSSALRRAFVNFGLGRELYDKHGRLAALRRTRLQAERGERNGAAPARTSTSNGTAPADPAPEAHAWATTPRPWPPEVTAEAVNAKAAALAEKMPGVESSTAQRTAAAIRSREVWGEDDAADWRHATLRALFGEDSITRVSEAQAAAWLGWLGTPEAKAEAEALVDWLDAIEAEVAS